MAAWVRTKTFLVHGVCKYEIPSSCGVQVFWCKSLSNQSDCETTVQVLNAC